MVTVNTAATTNAIRPTTPEITPEKFKITNTAASNNLIARSALPIFFFIAVDLIDDQLILNHTQLSQESSAKA